jgi:hypothetical protein
MRWFLRELARRDPLLARLGWAFFALAVVMALAIPFDARQVLGISVWIKPIKFAISIGIYLWTVAWLLEHVPNPRWCKQLIRWGVATTMIAEIVCIAGQSLRGVPSHFNHSTPLDSTAFAIMGIMIFLNTILEFLLLLLFLRPFASLPPAYVWGIRLGLIGALLSAAIGGVMIRHGAHTVGAPDGGPGLWLVNWSLDAGDLRVAHAVGLHALQILPLAGYGLSRIASRDLSVALLAGLACAYGVVFLFLYIQAAMGQPMLGRPRILEVAYVDRVPPPPAPRRASSGARRCLPRPADNWD